MSGSLERHREACNQNFHHERQTRSISGSGVCLSLHLQYPKYMDFTNAFLLNRLFDQLNRSAFNLFFNRLHVSVPEPEPS